MEIRKPEENQKLLIEIIKRFDSYVNACNTKVAVILSYCMACIGGLGFKLVDISDKRAHDVGWWIILVICFVSCVVTLWSARFAYQALAPQVPSGRGSHEPPSVIFFGDVATHPGGRDGYVESINSLTEESVVRDLASQAHTLAQIARSKFALIEKATKCLVQIQIPMFALILVLLLTTLQQPGK